MKESLREKILIQFQSRYRQGKQDFVNGGQIEKFAEALGYKASNASRRLREIYNEGLLEREERPLKDSHIRSVWYKYIPTDRDKLVYSLHDK